MRITVPAPPDGRYPTKQAMVLASLRAAIDDGRLAPGARIVIDEVARQLGVSIIPVREALHQLQAERLIAITPHTGVIVSTIEPEAVAELFTLLEGLECAAAALAVERADEDGLSQVSAAVDALDLALVRSDAARFAALNRQFHAAVCQAARAPRILEALERAHAEWTRLHRLAFAHHGGTRTELRQAQDEHRSMLVALRSRDAARAQELARIHNRGARQRYERVLR